MVKEQKSLKAKRERERDLHHQTIKDSTTLTLLFRRAGLGVLAIEAIQWHHQHGKNASEANESGGCQRHGPRHVVAFVAVLQVPGDQRLLQALQHRVMVAGGCGVHE